MTTTSWRKEFLERLAELNTALGGDPIELSEPVSFEADSLILLSACALAAAAGSGGGSSVAVGAVSVAELTGTWSTDVVLAYVELGYTDESNNLRVSVAVAVGDRVLLIPPEVSHRAAVYSRLQRSMDGGVTWTDVLLGDGSNGGEPTTWGHCYHGGSAGPARFGLLPLGTPRVDMAPVTGTAVYRIQIRFESRTLWLGQTHYDAGIYIIRPSTQFIAVNLGQ